MSEFTAEIIQKAAAGDQDSITNLYELTYSGVYKTVKSMIRDEDTVLDIVQDSYIKGFQNLNQLSTPENFRAWIKRIATNKAKDYIKKKKPVLFSEMENEDGEEVDFKDEQLDHCPEEVLDHKETTRLMEDILSGLSEEQRLVIGMFYYEEMSVREIAETLGCSENTVKSRLSYGRKKIEAQVLELEKKGTKLYSLAPMPFLLWLFRMDAEAAATPSAAVLEAVTAECAAAGITAAGSAGAAAAVGTGVKTAVAAGTKVLLTKVIAGVLAAAVVGGGALVALSPKKPEPATPAQQITQNVSERPESTAEPTAAPSAVPTPEATPTPAPIVTAEEAYEKIAAEYQAAIEADSADFLNAPGNYFNGDHFALQSFHKLPGLYAYLQYAYYDIDKNGTDELLIGTRSGQTATPVDIYGFDGEKAVQLIDDPDLGNFSNITIYADGTIYHAGGNSMDGWWQKYLRVDGCTVEETSPTTAEAVTDILWKPFTTSYSAFDPILADITTALTVPAEEYDANAEHYDTLYSHLGDGAMWQFTHKQFGDMTMSFWNAYQDMDGDGMEDLVIGRGANQNEVYPSLIFTQTGDVIYGDAIFTYTEPLYGGSTPSEWAFLG